MSSVSILFRKVYEAAIASWNSRKQSGCLEIRENWLSNHVVWQVSFCDYRLAFYIVHTICKFGVLNVTLLLPLFCFFIQAKYWIVKRCRCPVGHSIVICDEHFDPIQCERRVTSQIMFAMFSIDRCVGEKLGRMLLQFSCQTGSTGTRSRNGYRWNFG